MEKPATSPLIQSTGYPSNCENGITNLRQLPRYILEVMSDAMRDVGDLESADNLGSLINSLDNVERSDEG